MLAGIANRARLDVISGRSVFGTAVGISDRGDGISDRVAGIADQVLGVSDCAAGSSDQARWHFISGSWDFHLSHRYSKSVRLHFR